MTSTVAAELGLHAATLGSWLGREERSPTTFARVEVLAEPAARDGALVVYGPHGLRIEGLDLEGVVTLMRRLG
jgi:hypothetical protein